MIRSALRDSAGILVVGQEGSGRSRLLAEAVAAFDGRGAAVRRVAGAGTEVPFGALAHLLPGSPEAVNPIRWAAEVICASVRPGEGSWLGPGVVRGRGAGSCLVLAVDDGHLLDGHSAAAIRFLVAHRGARVVVTSCAGAALPAAVASLWKDGWLSRLDLAPLSAGDCGRLLAAVLGGEVEAATARSLRHAAGGNVRLLVELACSQPFARVDGRWRWRGELMLTERLRQMVEAQIGALDDAERETLELVAVGEPFALDELTRLSSSETVERMERRGLLTVQVSDSGVSVRLAHPLHRQVIRAWSTPVATRNRLSRVGGPRHPQEVEGAVLSARELEVARLASWNLTNREIADWLALSHRTVGNHLCNVYTKLGVNDRLDLAPLLVRAGRPV
ncbi:helix-turn-helix transcriptional regulator [Sphaerisporangium flaviroseum]|uniref:helix-turn-helix transcriptional regulator n=1 Tax=Sphaerisporangium flaviroseum TaxID=509199 RepID=UPI0031F1B3FB